MKQGCGEKNLSVLIQRMSGNGCLAAIYKKALLSVSTEQVHHSVLETVSHPQEENKQENTPSNAEPSQNGTDFILADRLNGISEISWHGLRLNGSPILAIEIV